MTTQSISFVASNTPINGITYVTAEAVSVDLLNLINDYNLSIGTNKIADSAVTLAKIAAEPWTDFTPIFTGFSTDPTVGVSRYVQIGKTVIWRYASSAAGLSNSTGFAMTLPVAAKTASVFNLIVGVLNDTTWSAGSMAVNTNGLTVSFSPNPAGTGTFGTSGQGKDAYFEITYEAA